VTIPSNVSITVLIPGEMPMTVKMYRTRLANGQQWFARDTPESQKWWNSHSKAECERVQARFLTLQDAEDHIEYCVELVLAWTRKESLDVRDAQVGSASNRVVQECLSSIFNL